MASTKTNRIKATADAYTGGTEVSKRFSKDLERTVLLALSEDTGVELPLDSAAGVGSLLRSLDVTTSAIVPADATAKAVMLVKAPGVVAGLDVAEFVFRTLDPNCTFTALVKDGDEITNHRTPIARIEGNARAILLAERTALNLIQRLSGIATVARKFSAKARPLEIAIVDTRKTTPGLRTLEKFAVQVGGAANHRYGLYDAILIKDNHIRVAGGITPAIQAARTAQPGMPVEVETATLAQVEEALLQRAEKIMLDNMTPEMIMLAVRLINGRSLIEVSGGVNESNLASYLIPGVDAISIGALTHSVRSLDISLDIEV